MDNKQLIDLANGLNEALECVLIAYYKKINMSDEVGKLERIHQLAKELLSSTGASNKH